MQRESKPAQSKEEEAETENGEQRGEDKAIDRLGDIIFLLKSKLTPFI